MIQLRDYQEKIIVETRAALKLKKSALIRAGVGSGKTVISAFMTEGTVGRGKRVMFTVHRDFLLEQTEAQFRAVGVQSAFIASGRKPDPDCLAQIASIGSLANRLEKVPVPDLIIVDEAHHIPSRTWSSSIQYFTERGALLVGLSASPWRQNGEGLGKYFGAMVQGPSVRWLMDNGYLSDYRAFAPSTPDLSGVHTENGDFNQTEIAEIMDKPSITGNILHEYLNKAAGLQAVGFYCSREHSMHVAAEFQAAGIEARHIDAKTPAEERQHIVAEFRAGRVRKLCNLEIFTEGFDLPGIEVVILGSPTKSLVKHIQTIGRALRPAAGKDRALILDHAGNCMRLGLPDTDYQWSLEGRVKGKKEADIAIKQCPECHHVHSPAPHCPECGTVYAVKERKVIRSEGELEEIDRAKFLLKEQLKYRIAGAKTLAELIQIGREQGYNKGWAFNVYKAKKEKENR